MGAKQLTGVKKYSEMRPEAVSYRVRKMTDLRDGLDISGLHISLSYGNRKTGSLVPSISLIPVADCCNCASCARGCYAVRHIAYRKESQAALAQNSALAHGDLPRYFVELDAASKFIRFFRYHVSGDILSTPYLAGMVDVAQKNPHCQFLAFTKAFGIVNDWIDAHGDLPKNLQIIFSEWRGLSVDNPHNLPTSRPLWKGEEIEGTMCPGSCAECAAFQRGCWTLKKGERVLFEAH